MMGIEDLVLPNPQPEPPPPQAATPPPQNSGGEIQNRLVALEASLQHLVLKFFGSTVADELVKIAADAVSSVKKDL